jgi:hypothetical protein
VTVVFNFKLIKGPPDDDPIGIETCRGNKTTLTFTCNVNHFYFIVVLKARTRTICNTTQQDENHEEMCYANAIQTSVY